MFHVLETIRDVNSSQDGEVVDIDVEEKKLKIRYSDGNLGWIPMYDAVCYNPPTKDKKHEAKRRFLRFRRE